MSSKNRLRSIQTIIVRYLFALITVVSGYFLYAEFAVPAILGDQVSVKRSELPTREYEIPFDDKNEYQHLFAGIEGCWELQPCKSIEITKGKILFKEYDPQPDGSLKVEPFSMILESSSDQTETDDNQQKVPKKTPMVLRGDKAILRFDKPVVIGQTQGSVNLTEAQLAGRVRLFRPDKDSPVELVTTNVQITEDTIYTLDEVAFRFGKHTGTGRNLSIELAHKSGKLAIQRGFSQIDGIKKIRIANLGFLQLEPKSEDAPTVNSLTKSKPMARTNSAKLFARKKSPIRITCKGSFQFDFLENRAAFRKQVKVKQLDQHGDQLECEKLDLLFQRVDATPRGRRSGNSPTNQLSQNTLDNADFELIEFLATGSPAIITAPSRNVRIVAEFLNYDIQNGQVRAQSGGQVEIQQGESRIVCQQITYDLTDDESLGKLDAVGAGSMVRVGKKGKDPFHARWTNYLTIRDEGNGKKIVTIDGGAKLELDKQTRLDSESIKFWIWEIARFGREGSFDHWEYQPAKLHTTGTVDLAAANLIGKTNEFVATWPDNPQKSILRMQPLQPNDQGRINRNRFNQGGLDRGHPNLNGSRMVSIWKTGDQTQRVRRVSFEEEVPKRKPLFFKGDYVEVKLRGDQQNTVVTDLEIKRNVMVWQLTKDQPQKKDLEIFGSYLRAFPQAKDSYRLQVEGTSQQLAKVIGKGLKLTGPVVFLDQSANRMWVDGPGQMELDRIKTKRNNLLSQPAYVNTPRPTEPRRSSGKIDVAWQGGMIFDGLKIYFEDQVTSQSTSKKPKGISEITESRSQALSILLQRRVNLAKLDSENQPDVDVREMLFVQNLPEQSRVFRQSNTKTNNETPPSPIVLINKTFDSGGNLIEKQKLVGPNATIQTASNVIRSRGPGSIIVIRRNDSKTSTPLSFGIQNRKSNQPRKPFTFIQIGFDDELILNADTRDMTVDGNIRALYSPLDSPDQEHAVSNQSTLQPGAVRMTCEQMQISQWTPEATGVPTTELQANGNSHIISDTFEATSNRVSFDENTGVMTMEGTPRSDGHLWTRSDPRSKPNHLTFGKIRYRPADGTTRIEKASAQIRGSR